MGRRAVGAERPPEPVPVELVQSVLREHLADPAAHLTDLQVGPLPSDGYSGNQLYRARLTWSGRANDSGGSVTWLFKRWLPGGHSERLLGLDRPLEALAWEQGILRPGSLPPGVVAPMVGARLDPGRQAAWIVMRDVSAALGEYTRERPLPPAEAVARVKQVLDGLARLHAWWERPDQRAKLHGYTGLVPFERFLWCEAASYATALGRRPPRGAAPGSPVTDELRADLQAFLAWLPAGDRRPLERLLDRREPLVSALAPFPRSLLHGDTGDRNLGLACPVPETSGREESARELVLIDWEWITVGPPALDVARVCGSAPAVCDLTQPAPEALFSGELPDHYFERYRSYGGLLADCQAWRRSFDLALLAGMLGQVPFAGAMIRQGITPVVTILGRQVEMILATARSLTERPLQCSPG
jgi:hypothetical protein